MTNPQTIPGRRACCYSMPDNVPHSLQSHIDRLHLDAGSLAWTYEQYVAECKQLDLPAVDEKTWQGRRLADLRRLRETFEAAEAEIVRDARRAGITWEMVGSALGTTKQAAHLRFGK